MRNVPAIEQEDSLAFQARLKLLQQRLGFHDGVRDALPRPRHVRREPLPPVAISENVDQLSERFFGSDTPSIASE